jgi:hypothetical protein
MGKNAICQKLKQIFYLHYTTHITVYWDATPFLSVRQGRLRLKCDGTRTESRFRLSLKRTSPFKSAEGVSSVGCWQPRCAVVMLDAPCSEVVWRVLATHSICHFPLHLGLSGWIVSLSLWRGSVEGAWGGVPSLGMLEDIFGRSPDTGISLYGGPFAVRGTWHGRACMPVTDGWMKKGSSGGVPLCKGLH